MHENLHPIYSRSESCLLCSVILVLLVTPSVEVAAHEGPNPVAHWSFDSRSIEENRVSALIGPDGILNGRSRLIKDEFGESLQFTGWSTDCVVAEDINDVRKFLPKRAITISAWVTVDKRQPWGGIVGAIQDNGNAEQGWVLGYDNDHFYVGLASSGADDGDGMMTYLKGSSKYELGRWYHVVATFDGEQLKLYVNGETEAASTEQSGEVLYPNSASLVIGAYRDRNENFLHQGRIREVRIYDLAAKETWVAGQFERQQQLASVVISEPAGRLKFEIKPYLQFGTQSSMTVMWQTNLPGKSIVHYGKTAECSEQKVIDGSNNLHEVELTGLDTEQLYFYRAETVNESGESIYSEGYTFTTAVKEDTPYAFAVIGDTQGNPTVSAQLSKLAWAQRPSFCLHAGDLVDTGTNDSNWKEHFFPGMEELICRVPLFPVLGNHEQDARNYYNYMSLPEPEYYYAFKYGNAEFFMIDSNRNVNPGSKQYKWLDERLDDSDAEWKFVCHHHPPYSSDEDDYGDLWHTSKSSHGDTRIRDLVPLYEKHDVDIVWNGHIHSYERTWPVKKGKAKQKDAPIYVIAGGGGGGLETPGPVRPFFQNLVRRGHHYVMVHVNGETLEFRAYTLDDRLFDTFRIKK